MALTLNKTLDNGAVGAYHVVKYFEVDIEHMAAIVHVSLYKDSSSIGNGLVPLETIRISVPLTGLETQVAGSAGLAEQLLAALPAFSGAVPDGNFLPFPQPVVE